MRKEECKMDEKMLKLEEIVKNEEKVRQIFTGTSKEIMEKLAANGIELTQEEFDAINAGMHENGNDLTEQELDSVAGGCRSCYDFFHKVGRAISKALDQIFGGK